ncbi:MAG: GxxExxY protein [Parachlamydiales bacterium]|jgi:GxxExxY protein
MENELSRKIIAAAIEVHNCLGGPGLLESVYEAALYHELKLMKFSVQQQIPIQVIYKGQSVKDPFYLDLLVENKIIVEVKATESNNPLFQSQLLTYLRLSNKKLGLIINFGKKQIKEGISRVVNGLDR